VAIVENTYETLITNLPENEFSMAKLQHQYHLRWGIETLFRELKYSLALTYLHS
jgi:IS4 transposase